MDGNITRDECQVKTKKCSISGEVLLRLRIINWCQGAFDPSYCLCHVRIGNSPDMLQMRRCISHHGSGLRAWEVEKGIKKKERETISQNLEQKKYEFIFFWKKKKIDCKFRENFLTDSQQKGERKSHEFHGGRLQHQDTTLFRGWLQMDEHKTTLNAFTKQNLIKRSWENAKTWKLQQKGGNKKNYSHK